MQDKNADKIKDVHATLITNKSRRAWIEVEIFLRVKGRLPEKKGDKLTAEMCEEFIERYSDHPQHGKWVGDAFEIMAELMKEESNGR